MKNIATMFVMMTMLMSLFGAFLIAPVEVASAEPFSDDLIKQMDSVGLEGYNATTDPDRLTKTVGRIIKIVLGFLGIVLIVIVIYAGFLWMTAGGEPDGVKKAKDWLTNAIIGLAIILSAYAITDFVISKLIIATMTP